MILILHQARGQTRIFGILSKKKLQFEDEHYYRNEKLIISKPNI